MVSGFDFAVVALLIGYLTLFGLGSAVAAQDAGRSVWLFALATGRDRWAAIGFRAAFAIAAIGPLVWSTWPALGEVDPLWTKEREPAIGAAGVLLASIGAMLAFAAQMSMGTSWRVGVVSGATGDLVSSGLYRFSRNPTFMGQFALLAGVAVTIPTVPTVLAPILFLWSAVAQVQSEETALRQALGAAYDQYTAKVPRWIGVPRKGSP